MARNHVVVVCLLSLASCSHAYQFKPEPNVSALAGHKLAGRALAVDLSGVPESYEGSAQGHSYTLTGIREQAQSIVRRLFANEPLVADPYQADAVLRLTVEIDLGAAFFGTTCSATSRWQIEQADRTVVGEATNKMSIPSMAVGGNNCELAMLQSLAAALDDAFAKL